MNNLNFDMLDMFKTMDYQIISIDYVMRQFGMSYAEVDAKKRDGIIKFKELGEI